MDVKRLIEALFVAIATFIGTALTTTALGYMLGAQGEYRVWPEAKRPGKTFMEVDISNFGRKMLDDVRLSIPSSVSSVYSPEAIHVTVLEQTHNSSFKVISLSGIQSRSLIRVYLETTPGTPRDSVALINADDRGLERAPAETESRLGRTLTALFPSSILYALLFGIMAYYDSIRKDKLRQEVNEVRGDLKKLQENTDKEIKERYGIYMRMKLLLIARLRDYSKELTFWRDAVRKAALQNGPNGNEHADQITRAVSETLQTYKTQGKASGHFEEINMLANLFSKNEPTEADVVCAKCLDRTVLGDKPRSQ